MNAATMRSAGWRNVTTRDADALVIGRRYIVSNGKKVEAVILGENLDGSYFWDQADTESEVELGELRQWPWFKEDAE